MGFSIPVWNLSMFSKFEENNYCTIAGSGSRFFTSDNLWGGN